MPLIELLNTTKLRSLGFGHDQPHGGSSAQPFIQTQIPTKKELDSPSPDFLLRGATNGSTVVDTVNDIGRIGRWFLTSPGLLFLVKQNLLSRNAAATDVSSRLDSGLLNGGIYTPVATLAQVGVSAFGLHLNKQGLNPIPTDPNAGIAQGFLSAVGSQPLYGKTVFDNSLTGSNIKMSGLLSTIGSLANKLGILSGKKINMPILVKPVGLDSVITYENFLLKLHSKRI